MDEIQYKEIINRLEAIYEMLYSIDNQEQLIQSLDMFQKYMAQQTEVADLQKKLLKQIDKSLNEENNDNEL
jgi:cell fate (sporulation/competence/biofilm development) regulator YmcA (YheA/YmcA/DUF963 family)